MKSIVQNFLISVMLFLFSEFCLGQGKDSSKVFTFVEDMPEFPGGEKELFKYIRENIDNSNSCSGRAYVNFMIDTLGVTKNVKILRGLCEKCDAEAIRVVRSLPAWAPGMHKGRKVEVQYNLPINFPASN